MLEQIKTAVFSFTFLSIPEEFCIIYIILLLINLFKKFDERLDFKEMLKFNKLRFIFPVLIPASVTTIIRYGFKIDININLLIAIFLVFFSIVICFKLYFFKGMLISFFCTLISIFMIVFFEMPYYFWITSKLQVTMEQINQDVFSNFVFILPLRVLQIGFILLLVKHKSFENLKFIELMVSFKENIMSGIFVLTFCIMWIAGFGKLFVLDKMFILVNTSVFEQVLYVSGILLVPIVVIYSTIMSMYNVELKYRREKFLRQEELKSKANVLKYYTEKHDYDKINAIAHEIDHV